MEVKWPLRRFCSPNNTAELLRKECEFRKKKTRYLALGNRKEFIFQMKTLRIKKQNKTELPVDRGSEKDNWDLRINSVVLEQIQKWILI